MNNHNIQIRIIKNLSDADADLRKVGIKKIGRKVISPKIIYATLKLNDVNIKKAIILKQTMLAIGGDAALSHKSLNCADDSTDVILMGTLKQHRKLIKNLKNQPFGLSTIGKGISQALSNFYKKDDIKMKIGNEIFHFGKKTFVMGILNVTPDSFADGGKYMDVESAVSRAYKMVDEGADIIDIGGESSRPGSEPISVEEEIKRVNPVIKRLVGEIDVPLSIDTYKPEVARSALDIGVDMVNDIYGLRMDGMADVVSEYDVPVIIMHMKGHPKNMQVNPVYDDVIGEISAFFYRQIDVAKSAGIKENKIILDPGIGFGKSVDHNLTIIRKLEEFRTFGRPLLIGVSRKSFIGNILDLPIEERLEGTLAASSISIMNGADIIRMHDVKEAVRAARIADSIKNSPTF